MLNEINDDRYLEMCLVLDEVVQFHAGFLEELWSAQSKDKHTDKFYLSMSDQMQSVLCCMNSFRAISQLYKASPHASDEIVGAGVDIFHEWVTKQSPVNGSLGAILQGAEIGEHNWYEILDRFMPVYIATLETILSPLVSIASDHNIAVTDQRMIAKQIARLECAYVEEYVTFP